MRAPGVDVVQLPDRLFGPLAGERLGRPVVIGREQSGLGLGLPPTAPPQASGLRLEGADRSRLSPVARPICGDWLSRKDEVQVQDFLRPATADFSCAVSAPRIVYCGKSSAADLPPPDQRHPQQAGHRYSAARPESSHTSHDDHLPVIGRIGRNVAGDIRRAARERNPGPRPFNGHNGALTA